MLERTGSGGCIRRWGRVPGPSRRLERYVSSQVGDADVALGDTSVPELMQTDAFQVMVKDANFRALASDPGFAALASNPAAMAAIAANPAQFAELAQESVAVPRTASSRPRSCRRIAGKACKAQRR